MSSPRIIYWLLLPLLVVIASGQSFAQQANDKSDERPKQRSTQFFEGSAVKMVGQWVIEVAHQPGTLLYLKFESDGSYSTRVGDIRNEPVETGKIKARAGNYTLVALTGEQTGKRDEGSYQFPGNNQLVLRGLFGKGTWTRTDDEGAPLAPLNTSTSEQRRTRSAATASGRAEEKKHDIFDKNTFIPEVIGTARPSWRNASEDEQEVKGTALPFGRNEMPGSNTSGFAVPPRNIASTNQTASAKFEDKIQEAPGPAQRTSSTLASAQNTFAPQVVTPTEAVSKPLQEPAAAARPQGNAKPDKVISTANEVSAQGKSRPIKDKWALVIGISKFQKPELNLNCPAKDAIDFGNFLVQQCHFANDHVRVLTDDKATRSQILNELGDKWLPRVVRPDDLVIVYISTHGSPSDADVGGVNYLLACDTDPDSLYASGLPMQDLTRIIKGRLKSDRVMMVLDACYSGNVAPQSKGLSRGSNIDVEEIAQGTGQLVISSSQPNQISWEAKNGVNSVFTKHLMASLRIKGDKTSLGEAFRTLRERVEDEVQRDRGRTQIPVMKSQWEGADLMISVPPVAPRPGL